jgi:hypothetical protein
MWILNLACCVLNVFLIRSISKQLRQPGGYSSFGAFMYFLNFFAFGLNAGSVLFALSKMVAP